MNKHRSLTALALVFALVCALAVPAGAASTPKLTYRQSGTSAQLTLQNLGEESIYGVELELKLKGRYESATLAPSSSTAYAPPCTCVVTEEATVVTIYLTDQSPLNQKGSLALGSLTLPTSFTMPATAAVTLLGRDLQPLTNAQAITVSRQTTTGSGSSGTSRPGTSTTTPEPKPDPDPEPETPPAPAVPFTDVAEDDWFFDAVKYVYDAGLMNGTSDNIFTPNAPTSRAMLVTILYRLADAPPAQTPTFPDIPLTQYYTYPVGWAAAQSIVTGYEDGLFRPNDSITREQLATILYRYSRAMGYNTNIQGNLSSFSDRTQISDYAQTAMSWAVGTGLISGMDDGTVNPTGPAIRAQVATILTRFCKNVAKRP